MPDTLTRISEVPPYASFARARRAKAIYNIALTVCHRASREEAQHNRPSPRESRTLLPGCVCSTSGPGTSPSSGRYIIISRPERTSLGTNWKIGPHPTLRRPEDASTTTRQERLLQLLSGRGIRHKAFGRPARQGKARTGESHARVSTRATLRRESNARLPCLCALVLTLRAFFLLLSHLTLTAPLVIPKSYARAATSEDERSTSIFRAVSVWTASALRQSVVSESHSGCFRCSLFHFFFLLSAPSAMGDATGGVRP